jgi:8-oxo-dGTP pyrophosphatase MutT (NUDIX family)
MPPIRQAAGIVLLTRSRPQQLLLLKHATRWDLPKGHVDDGEDLIATALRETAEETGLDVAEIDLDQSFVYEVAYDVDHQKYGRYHKQVFYYLGYIDQACEIHPTEHIGYRWWPWPPGPIQVETIDPLLAAVQKHLGV